MTFDVADAVDDLRQLIAKADALVHATEDPFDHIIRASAATGHMADCGCIGTWRSPWAAQLG